MDYDKSQYKGYLEGRKLSKQATDLWMNAVAEFLTPGRNGEFLDVLDLGCGVGRWSVPLAERLGAQVIGVEPSEKMRQQAEAKNSHKRVTYLAGYAEDIPCRDGTFDAAFLSMIAHHLQNLSGACGELWRVLRPGGVIFIRNCFRGRLDGIPVYEFWPAAKAIDEVRMPGLGELTACFTSAGFERIEHRAIVQHIDASLRAHYERLKLGAVSTFDLISEEELREGFEAMARAVAAERTARAVTEPIDFLVFRKVAAGWPACDVSRHKAKPGPYLNGR
ncbi:MAG: methyltransferase domain-containing protein [Phycisphaerae bacterium]|nr:methyltransferase domain-containing protein [Phycisphaerae bacterium]